jgi:Asp-tRNA(Asn)/Glu-tRNA(Gln) amidotransferase A subunit family amidase
MSYKSQSLLNSFGVSESSDGIDRRQLLRSAAAAAFASSGVSGVQATAGDGMGLHELGLSAAARAIRNGAITSEAYASALLGRARAQADLRSFITIDETRVLEAARVADKARASGKTGPLLGVPIGVKDSYMTRGLDSTFGTAALNGFKPTRDAVVVAAVKESGAIVLGKNNLAEMSYGLTGDNEHHGQVKNPYNRAHLTGGSSSGAGASVAARIVPAALGGDTVGSIRIPASLCGAVGFKPTPGRWSSEGIAPISSTLDSAGVLTRSVEDCILMDSIVTREVMPQQRSQGGLKGVRLAYAPRQYLQEIDPGVDSLFKERLRQFKDAGADLIEVDLGSDFTALIERSTWPIFFHETMPEVRGFIDKNNIPVTFEEIYRGLGSHIKGRWSRFVVSNAPNYFSDETYKAVMEKNRPELQRRYRTMAFARADALIFPTTPCTAPMIENQWKFVVAGKEVSDTFLAKNTHLANCVGLPGISIPMGLSSDGLPVGLELDANAGHDRSLLELARRVEQVIGTITPPPGI